MFGDTHVLTFDVEDYDFLVCRDWLGVTRPLSDQVVKDTQRVLDLLDVYNTKATFFVMGMVAQQFPKLVRDIHSRGHEVASHSYAHTRVNQMTPNQFSADLNRSIRLLEDITGQRVLGFRAPYFSIPSTCHWALDIVADLGLNYDSSFIPDGRRLGLSPGPHRLPRGLIEVPLSTLRILGARVKMAGGGQLRRLPPAVVKYSVRRIAAKQPLVLYFHTYDLDTQGRPLWNLASNAFKSIKLRMLLLEQYFQWHTTATKLSWLLNQFKFTSIASFIGETDIGDRKA